MAQFPYTVKALRVEQPIGVYFVVVLPAELLLQVAFSHALSARLVEGSYILDGTQRSLHQKRLDPIAGYLNRIDAAFPNSIILAANYRQEDGRLEDPGDDSGADEEATSQPEVEDRRWSVEEDGNGCHALTIPTSDKLAAIIDGQHRLFAFTYAHPERRPMQLICSIFLDLPKPYQAQLFATINSTQKRVDKSLTYELFGYNVADEPEGRWSPDKLSVFLTRRFNTEEGSPLRGRVLIAPMKDEVLAQLNQGQTWTVSTAVIVEGIMRLFTSNPKSDSTSLLEKPNQTRSTLAGKRNDKSPLRSAYLESNDMVIYTLVLNYLRACQQLFWKDAPAGSYITKTIGIQALLDILRSKLAGPAFQSKTISTQHFVSQLQGASDVDYTSTEFRNLSGAGRSYLRRKIEAAAGL